MQRHYWQPQFRGSDLRDLGDENAAKSTPKTATIGGVMFYRSKNGNLYRSGIVKAHRYDAQMLRQRLDERLALQNTTNVLTLGGGG
jgi:hypothetical protein